MSAFRITVDTLPGEIVLVFEEERGDDYQEALRAVFDSVGWPRFVSAVISAAPFGVPPAL